MKAAEGPLLICYDGSEDAKYAIERAGLLARRCACAGRDGMAAVAGLGKLRLSGAAASMVDFVGLDRAAAEDGGRIANEGVRIARDAGLEAEPVAIEATGPVWKTILDIADRHDAAMIVMGSRGLTGVRSMLLGSVSSAVVHHADRPTLVIRQLACRAQGDTPAAAAWVANFLGRASFDVNFERRDAVRRPLGAGSRVGRG